MCVCIYTIAGVYKTTVFGSLDKGRRNHGVESSGEESIENKRNSMPALSVRPR